MSASVSVAAVEARNPSATSREETCGDVSVASVFEIFATSRKGGTKWFPGLAKRLSKDKAPAAIHHLTGEAERTCYDWCKGAVDPPARLVIKLLHSEVGWTVLEYLMRGCDQPWWDEVKRARNGARAFREAWQQEEMDV
jgi:hypothetical protein